MGINIRKNLEPETSWGNSWCVRHIQRVTRSPTGLPQQIFYDYDYLDYDTKEIRQEAYSGSCRYSTFMDWVEANGGRWVHDE